MKALPSNEALFKELSPKGVHMFFVHAQKEDKEWMTDYAQQRGLTFPIAMLSDCDFIAYDLGERVTLPYAFVIGPDGKCVWQGKDGYEAQVRTQLARIKFPNLRRMDVAPELVAAATSFEAGNYADALAAAEKAKAAEGASEDAVTDADYVIAAVDEHVVELRAKIDQLKAARRYHEALPLLEKLAGKAYKGLSWAEGAADELKTLKADKAVKEELKAWEQLAKTLEANEKAKDEAERTKNLEKFIKRYEGTAAAEDAANMIPAPETEEEK